MLTSPPRLHNLKLEYFLRLAQDLVRLRPTTAGTVRPDPRVQPSARTTLRMMPAGLPLGSRPADPSTRPLRGLAPDSGARLRRRTIAATSLQQWRRHP